MNVTDLAGRSPTWCPGCGNYGIWAGLKNTIIKLGWQMHEFVIVYGIGCSGNMTDFIKSHGFHALHGRAIPAAIGIKLANHKLKVICVVGDGDFFGEGGNHFLHAVRGNHDMTVIVHDNRVYGLTTGQTAPTSPKGYKSKSTPAGVIEEPIHGLPLALIQGASFVAQAFAGDATHLQSVFEKALLHKGFALVNVLQPCVTFNKINTYQYYRERVYKLEEAGHDPQNFHQALDRMLNDGEKIGIGVYYDTDKAVYHEQIPLLKDEVLVKQPTLTPDLNETFQEFI